MNICDYKFCTPFPEMSRLTSARRNIVVKSGMRENQEEDFQSTTPLLAARLELLFINSEENFENKLQRQQEMLAAEKEALDRRFGTIEAQLQTFATKHFKSFFS